MTTTFCYGCNLGPTQTARSLPTFDRHQVAHVNQRHASEAFLDNAIVQVVNAYNQFTRPQLWGSGHHVAADGTKWLFFGGEGVITENRREEQWKSIKYNHLVANLLIFHNVVTMTKVLHQLAAEGQRITSAALANLGPYQPRHVNRFGLYTLQLDRIPAPVQYDLPPSIAR